jgi:GntR family transcriptional regulator
MPDEQIEPTGSKRDYVADVLRARIESGELAPGDRVPGENALIDEFGISQTTARAAINALRTEGLIRVVRGSGAFVRDFKPILRDATTRLSAKQWGSGHAIWQADLGLRQMAIEDVEVYTADAPGDVESILGVSRVVVRSRVYLVEGRPVQSSVSYLPAELVAGSPITRPDTGPGGTFARLRDLGHEPVNFIERVRCRMPRPNERKRLHLDVGQPVIEIRRTAATEDGRPVEVNDMVLVAEAYVLQWAFTS